MDDKMLELYEELQKEVSKFSKIKSQYTSREAQIDAEGIIKGLKIALEKIIQTDMGEPV